MSYVSPPHVIPRSHYVIPRAVAESTGPCDCAQGDTCVIGVQASHDFPCDFAQGDTATAVEYRTLGGVA